MSDRDTLADTLAAGMDTWPNRPWLVLPGPVDIGSELAEHLTKHLAGWRPPAREITTAAELDALPYGAIVLPKHSTPFIRTTVPAGFRWVAEGCTEGWTADRLFNHFTALRLPLSVIHVPTGPLTVLHVPAEEGGQ